MPRRSASSPIDEAYTGDNRWHSRNHDEDTGREAHGECELSTVAQRIPSPLGEKADPLLSNPVFLNRSPQIPMTGTVGLLHS